MLLGTQPAALDLAFSLDSTCACAVENWAVKGCGGHADPYPASSIGLGIQLGQHLDRSMRNRRACVEDKKQYVLME